MLGRGGRVVECTRLESEQTFTGLGSSNLPLSARSQNPAQGAGFFVAALWMRCGLRFNTANERYRYARFSSGATPSMCASQKSNEASA